MRRRRHWLGLVWLLPALQMACAPPRAQLAGRVVHGAEAVPQVEVTLDPLGEGERRAAVSDGDGVYRFPDLAPGSYRLSAAAPGPPRLGARSGKNPILLAAGQEQWIGLQLVAREEPTQRPAPFAAEGFGAVGGVLRFEGTPVSGGVVDLYLDGTGDNALRGPGFRQSLPSDTDGSYALDEVPEGRYHLVARRRESGAAAGPVLAGDLYGEALANPIPVRSGLETRLDIHLVRKERADDPNTDRLASVGAALRGAVVDAQGKPVAGVYVFAYRNRIIGHGMPDFRTLPTGADGRFALSLGEGGLFYVGAREHAGGSPRPGEWVGFYEGSPDHGMELAPGQRLDGVAIVVRRILQQ